MSTPLQSESAQNGYDKKSNTQDQYKMQKFIH